MDASKCGDGVINSNSEECDDGNFEDGDGCNSICQSEGLSETTIAALVIAPILIIIIGGLLVWEYRKHRKPKKVE